MHPRGRGANRSAAPFRGRDSPQRTDRLPSTRGRMIDNAPFAVLDPEFFVSLEERAPDPEFRELATRMLPSGRWAVVAGGVWTHLVPEGREAPRQGWKL